MSKNEIKKLLMSMRTSDNEGIINNLLGKIDLLPDEKIEAMASQIGQDEESIRNYLQNKIEEVKGHRQDEHTPINEMFSYGITGTSIHLHMPVDLHQMITQTGLSRTVDTVNLYLLDAIEKIRRLQNDGNNKFKRKNTIYMISPILVGREMRFLEGLDFETQSYRKKELQDEKFVSEHPEAMLATHIFGRERNVGSAKIGLDVINSDEWQEKRKKQVKAFEEKGIKLNTEGREMD